MSEATDKLILAQLKRIADALERQSPPASDMDFGQVSPRFIEPMVAPQHPGKIAETPLTTYKPWRTPMNPPQGRSGNIGKWGEGDWVLEDDDHTGEETE